LRGINHKIQITISKLQDPNKEIQKGRQKGRQNRKQKKGKQKESKRKSKELDTTIIGCKS
jgi:hypothetical protein